MFRRYSVFLAACLLFFNFALPCNETEAQTQFGSSSFNIGPSGGQVAAAFIGVIAVLGVGIYFIARSPRTTGCVMHADAGYELQGMTPGDPLYLLGGNTSALKAGDRVKVVGRKHHKGGARTIDVSRVAKDYGACPTAASAGTLVRPN